MYVWGASPWISFFFQQYIFFSGWRELKKFLLCVARERKCRKDRSRKRGVRKVEHRSSRIKMLCYVVWYTAWGGCMDPFPPSTTKRSQPCHLEQNIYAWSCCPLLVPWRSSTGQKPNSTQHEWEQNDVPGSGSSCRSQLCSQLLTISEKVWRKSTGTT